MNELYNAAGILNTLLMLCMIVGGYIALKSGRQQQAGTIQSQAIDALQAELASLQRRIEVLEKENSRLKQTIDLIKSALSQRGVLISINGDLVTISDSRGSSQSARIQEEQ
jgi:ABC-type phosphate transport system auxiliary subunit